MARIKGISNTCYRFQELRAANLTSETSALRKCGKWIENRVGVRIDDRGIPCVGDGDGFLNIEDGLSWEEAHPLRRAREESVEEMVIEEDEERLEEREGCWGEARGPLLSLPAEIILKILRFVVANGRTLHICPCKSAVGSAQRAVSIHQVYWDPAFQEVESADKLQDFVSMDILPIALVCRQLKEVAYSILYGENKWVLEIGPQTMSSRIECLDEQKDGLVSWSQVRDVPATGIPALYPLSRRAAAYIKDLTLCISCTECMLDYLRWYCYGENEEREAVRKQVKAVAKSFIDPKAHSLRRLTVCVGVLPRDQWRQDSKQLVLTRERKNGRILRPKESAMVVAGEQMSPRQKLYTGRMVSPLLRIRGVREVDVGGNVSKTLAMSLRSLFCKSLRSLSGDCRGSEKVDRPRRKRVRTQ